GAATAAWPPPSRPPGCARRRRARVVGPPRAAARPLATRKRGAALAPAKHRTWPTYLQYNRTTVRICAMLNAETGPGSGYPPNKPEELDVSHRAQDQRHDPRWHVPTGPGAFERELCRQAHGRCDLPRPLRGL